VTLISVQTPAANVFNINTIIYNIINNKLVLIQLCALGKRVAMDILFIMKEIDSEKKSDSERCPHSDKLV